MRPRCRHGIDASETRNRRPTEVRMTPVNDTEELYHKLKPSHRMNLNARMLERSWRSSHIAGLRKAR